MRTGEIPVRTAVVTGASAGVGRAVAHALARRGWQLGLIARDAGALEAVRHEAEAAGAPQVRVAAIDVADASAVFDAAGRFGRELGGIELWVNNAMVTVFGPVSALSPEEFRRVTEVTYLGYVHGTMAALRQMRAKDHGTILQVGSALAYRAIPLQSAYCGAKFAIRGFTDALRSELRHDGSRVRLTMVQLPAVNTPQFDWARSHMPRRAQPVPPIFQPDAVAEAVCRAAETAPREVWVGWSGIRAIIGTMLAPGILDRLLARQGYDGQMAPEARPPGQPDNLFAPVAGRHAGQGRFGAVAQPRVSAVNPALLRGVMVAALLIPAVVASRRLLRRGR
ncbi:SDR family oxidoreductase [Teichococcus aestuarii]|uniref:SDR family oxidoreductase n=1 Tax=Teichococcus aestuarii TaxID=568898 RepID=UPI0024820518|nr:SDR family oxidoreductase [Pseudoroseomonas aestuarii]